MSQLARIRIDIPPAVINNLDALIKNISEHSRKTYIYRGGKETDKKFFPVWNRLKTRDGGIVYEINAEHPIFLRLIEKFPECETKFKSLLKLIAAELPLNQLIVDLNGNKEIANADLYTAESVREILKIFTDGLSNCELANLLDNLKRDEPYKNFPQVIDEFLSGDVDKKS